MTRAPLAAGAACLVRVGGAHPAAASEVWCESDPVVLVTTPGGHRVPVFVLTGAAGLEHLPQVTAARYSYVAAPACGDAVTQVKLDVVPAALGAETFATRATSSTGPMATGTVLDGATGTSGQPMRLPLTRSVP
jgi:hypothetical protein